MLQRPLSHGPTYLRSRPTHHACRPQPGVHTATAWLKARTQGWRRPTRLSSRSAHTWGLGQRAVSRHPAPHSRQEPALLQASSRPERGPGPRPDPTPTPGLRRPEPEGTGAREERAGDHRLHLSIPHARAASPTCRLRPPKTPNCRYRWLLDLGSAGRATTLTLDLTPTLSSLQPQPPGLRDVPGWWC